MKPKLLISGVSLLVLLLSFLFSCGLWQCCNEFVLHLPWRSILAHAMTVVLIVLPLLVLPVWLLLRPLRCRCFLFLLLALMGGILLSTGMLMTQELLFMQDVSAAKSEPRWWPNSACELNCRPDGKGGWCYWVMD